MSSNDKEWFVEAEPVKLMIAGVDEIDGTLKTRYNTLSGAIRERYGSDISEDTGYFIDRIYNARDASAVMDAVEHVDESSIPELPEEVLEEVFDELKNPGIGTAVRLVDTKKANALCPRERDASKAINKSNREDVYLPDIIGDGDVYMAKTLSASKVRLAWGLDEDNEVIEVDNYDVWERLLGWKKLKDLPRGKNKVREQFGDQLSDETLRAVTGSVSRSSSSESDDTDNSSGGRATRTEPSDEVLNVAVSNRHRHRFKRKAEKIANKFDKDRALSKSVDTLILFPKTCDMNMTNHWWVPGDKGGKNAAIANCNKGTFEYLNQYDSVWHIEDYLDQAWRREFDSQHGPITLDAVDGENLVLHKLSTKKRKMFQKDGVMQHIPEALKQNKQKRRRPEVSLPHPDNMVYATVGSEDLFWMRPALREMDGPVLLYDGNQPRDMTSYSAAKYNYRLYARARLNEWDFSCKELERLEKCKWKMKLERGGYEFIETLGKLHDKGLEPYSLSPESRWDSQ